MNKQKTLILSLSAMLFIALAFIVYSWTEPTSMPSSYNVPLNTSPEHQIKPARLYVEAIYDYDDDRYYVNPSYESAFSGKITIQDTTQESDSPNTVATKSYVDEQIALVEAIVTGVQPLVNGAHTWDECTALNGTIVDTDVSLKQCRFESSSCPSGWNQYKNFSAADAKYCSTEKNYICTTASKNWSNQECYCIFGSGSTPTTYSDIPCCYPSRNGQGSSAICYATRTAIGCY